MTTLSGTPDLTMSLTAVLLKQAIARREKTMGFCEYKSHSGGREFKSPLLHQKERVNSTGLPLFYSIRGSWRSHPPLPILFKTAYHRSSYLTFEDVTPITCPTCVTNHSRIAFTSFKTFNTCSRFLNVTAVPEAFAPNLSGLHETLIKASAPTVSASSRSVSIASLQWF
jgi:hypothetical protein